MLEANAFGAQLRHTFALVANLFGVAGTHLIRCADASACETAANPVRYMVQVFFPKILLSSNKSQLFQSFDYISAITGMMKHSQGGGAGISSRGLYYKRKHTMGLSSHHHGSVGGKAFASLDITDELVYF